MSTCAGVLLYFLLISTSLGSSSNFGSSGLAHGLSGDPSGLYAVITMSFDLQKLVNFFCVKYG